MVTTLEFLHRRTLKKGIRVICLEAERGPFLFRVYMFIYCDLRQSDEDNDRG